MTEPIYALDTNILIEAFNKRRPDHSLVERIRGVDLRRLSLPAIVRAEVRYGALRSSDPERNLDRWEQILAPFAYLAFERSAADHHAEIRVALRSKPIGERDLMIAAIARSRGAIVITRNVGEFGRVPALLVEHW